MKKFNIIKLAVLGLAASCLAFTSCKDEEEAPAKAVVASVDDVTFAAVDAPEQTISVYADGTWSADVAEDWITVSPMTGVGNTDVVITVTNNIAGGILDTPRQGQVLFMGSSFERKGKLIVYQKGDKYKGIEEVTVSGAAALEEGGVAKVNDAQVVAVSKMGFVVTDGSTNLYVIVKEKATDIASADVNVGDVIFLNGERTKFNGIPAFKLDEYEVKSSGASSSASAKDITSGVDTYSENSSEYIKVDGSIVYGVLRIAGASKRVTILDPLAEFGIDNLNIHKVTVTGYYAGVNDGNHNIVINGVKDNGLDESLVPYPVIWSIGAGAKAAGVLNYTSASFAASSSFESIQGLGTISYVPALDDDGKPLKNDNNKYLLDVSGDNPRVTGPWPGDYWLFTGLGQVKAGSKMRIVFESRVSATGHKFWQLEYKDGDVWKVAGELQKTSEPGSAITFTHTMAADGSTNILIDETVSFNHNCDNGQFRFRCMANWQASGAGALAARNGGTARLAVTDTGADGVEYWPHLYMVEEGDGVDRPDTDPVYANIEVSEDVLAFEGTPAAPIKLTVKSDYDFTVAADVEWLSVDVAEGAAGEDVDIMVTCEPTTLSNLRQGNIKISSADSRKLVPVVQSAAGQELDAFISIAGGNTTTVPMEGGQMIVEVQSNTEYSYEISDSWITPAAETKALVEKTAETFEVARNTTGADRTATIRFFNEDKNLESILTVTQEGKLAYPANLLYYESWQGQSKASQKVEDWSLTNMIGTGVSGVTYAAGTANDIRWTYQQGTSTYLTYENELAPGFDAASQEHSAAHLYAGTGTYNKDESWVEIRDIKLSGQEALQFGAAIFGVADNKTPEKVSDLGYPIYYKFDNESDWTLIDNVAFKGNWHWYSLPAFAVPAGATSVSIRFEPQASNYARVDDCTLIGVSKNMVADRNILAQWGFTADLMVSDGYVDTFGGLSGTPDKEAGNGGMYIRANCGGNGKIEYFQIDKTTLDVNNKAARIIGGTGQPYVTGVWPGDYWMVTAKGGVHEAGTKVNISFISKCSGTGMRYWLLEYLDGDTWKPVMETVTEEIETKVTVTYNVKHSNTSEYKVNETITMSNAFTEVQFRYTCVANAQANDKGALEAPNGGTHRFSGTWSDTEHTSPCIKIVE